jgi:hypothetical protein
MSADHHDKVLTGDPHLLHLIAYTIVGTTPDLEDSLKSEVNEFSATGFRDFSRIAASDAGHVARHLSQQPGSGAGDPAALQRGPDRAATHDPLGARVTNCRSCSPAPGRSALDHRSEEA